jgi:hypothetical protein
MITKKQLKTALRKATGCRIQHTGWPCGTCFFSISDKLTNKDWQAVLLFRGDYKRKELNNLPKDINKSLEKVLSLCNEN